eukprot:9145645-Pyramimonas_sp.AAC.1
MGRTVRVVDISRRSVATHGLYMAFDKTRVLMQFRGKAPQAFAADLKFRGAPAIAPQRWGFSLAVVSVQEFIGVPGAR